MAAIGAIDARAAARGRPRRRRASSCSATRSSLFDTLAAHGHRRQLRRRDRRRQRRARADAGDAARLRRDDRQPAHAGGRPRAASARSARARGILYVVDNTMTSPWLFRPKSVRREPRRQRADQVHRRPRQRARRAASPTPASSTGRAIPNIADTYKSAAAGAVGHHSRCARRACATGAARWPPSRRTTSPSAPRRWRCGWSAPAPTRRRSPSSSRAHPKVRAVHYPGLAVASAARAGDARCSARCGGLFVVRARRRRRLLRLPQPPRRSSCSSSNLGDNRTLAIPVAHTIFWEMGPERRAAMGIADSLIRVSVGHRGHATT